MKKIKIIAGLTWSFAALLLILILYPGINSMSSAASRLPFMKINPNFTGGPIEKQIVSEGCTLSIHKPVFDGLLGERKSGFVQIDWRGNIPEVINDTIDFDSDCKADFSVSVNRILNKTTLSKTNLNVKDLNVSASTSYGWAVRIGLQK
jgi:hypothetical protein